MLASAAAAWLSGGCVRDPGRLVTVAARVEPSPAAWRVEHVTLVAASGLTLACQLRAPAGDSARRYPAALVAGGLRTGRRAATQLGVSWRGIAFACDYPFDDPGRRSLPAIVWRLPRLRAAIVGTPHAHRLAADYLFSRSDVDTNRVVAAGVSLGVPSIGAWSAADTRPAAVALLYGGGRLDLQLALAVRRALPGPVRRPVAWGLARLLRPLEPSRNVGAIAPRPVLIVTAAGDERIPAAAFEALVAAAREPREVIAFAGRHVGGEPELLAALTDTTVAWLQRVLPPAATAP